MSSIFTIVTNGRSGSTFLTRYLRGCEDVTVLPEVFHASFMKSQFKITNNYTFQKFQQECFMEPSKYIISVSKKHKTKHVGSKTVTGEIGWDNVHNLLDYPHNIQIVLLYRKNILHRYLSAFYGDQINKWHITSKEQRKAIPQKEVDIKWLSSKIEFEKTKLEKIVSKCVDKKYHIIEYEDLFKSFNDQMSKLYSYLKIEPLKKKPNDLTIKSVKNYSFIKNKKEINRLYGKEFGEIE